MYVCKNEEILCDGRIVVGRGIMRYSYALCNDIIIYIYSTKKLRKSQKTMIQNTKTNNYSILIYLFRYI